MFAILLLMILVPLIIIFFWFPFWVSIIILIIYSLVEIAIIIPTFTKVKPAKGLFLNSKNEERVFSKYFVFFSYPFGAKAYASIISVIQLSIFILTPLFFFKGLFIPAIIMGLNYFLVGILAVKLNPLFFLGEDIRKGNTAHLAEYETIKTIQNKIYTYNRTQSSK